MAPKIQWPLVLFSLLAGVGGCAFAFAGIGNALGEVPGVTFVVTIVAFVFVCIGGVCSVVHLATPKHAWAVVTHILSFSGISVELIMLGIACALMVVFVGCDVIGLPAIVKLASGLFGALSGVCLAFATGHGYLISSKPTWNTMKLPVAYTATSLVGGAFLYLFVASMLGANGFVVTWILGIALLCCFFNVVALGAYIGHLGRDIARTNKKLYERGIVACGMVTTLVLMAVLYAMAMVSSAPDLAFSLVAFVGCVAALIGGLALRMLMWIVGAGFLSLFDQARDHRSAILND